MIHCAQVSLLLLMALGIAACSGARSTAAREAGTDAPAGNDSGTVDRSPDTGASLGNDSGTTDRSPANVDGPSTETAAPNPSDLWSCPSSPPAGACDKLIGLTCAYGAMACSCLQGPGLVKPASTPAKN
jgi:hypothetical protein